MFWNGLNIFPIIYSSYHVLTANSLFTGISLTFFINPYDSLIISHFTVPFGSTDLEKNMASFLILSMLRSNDSWENLNESVIIIIISIMSYLNHGFPWVSFPTRLYRPLISVGLLGYILCPNRAAIDTFQLVVLLLFVPVKGSWGARCLWVPSYFSGSVQYVLFFRKHGFRNGSQVAV